ncbi:MAG: hypothetical protein PHG78_03180 [Bacteroidales bacterium]|nr:hypothetical protein [Bacteroidales bacterium]
MKRLIILIAMMSALNSCANANNNSDTTDNTNKLNDTIMTTIHLTKQQFLEKVVNYETNPTEWKYLGEKPAITLIIVIWDKNEGIIGFC